MDLRSARARSVIALITLCLLLGLGLRCYGLGAKAYGNDEATTSLRVAGATLADYRALFDGQPRTVAELRAYQEHLPGRNLGSVYSSLRSEDPQHPPLYYAFEYGVVQGLHGIAGHRALSVVFGFAFMAAFGWFVYEFALEIPAVIAGLALSAVSPFFIMYSQQAREYSLWALLTALSSALLLRVLRLSSTHNTRWLCAAYGLSIFAGLSTALLFLGVLMAQLIVLFMRIQERPARQLLLWLRYPALIFAGIWVPAVIHNTAAVTNNSFLGAALPLKTFVAKWLENIALVGSDFGLLPRGYGSRLVIELGAVSMALTLVFVLYFGWRTLRSLSRTPLTLILGLIFVPALLLLIPDLLHHESRSTAARYLVPTWVGVETVLAVGIGKLYQQRRQLGLLAVAFFVACGTASAVLRESVPAWWTDWSAYAVVAQATTLSTLPAAPLHIAYIEHPAMWDFSVMELVNVLNPAATITLYPDARTYRANPRREAYLLDLDPTAQAALHGPGAQLRQIDAAAETTLAPALLAKRERADPTGLPISVWQYSPGS